MAIYGADEFSRDLRVTTRSRCTCADWSRTSDSFDLYLDAGQSPQGLPPMRGYLIGNVVASDMAKNNTIAGLARLQPAELEPQMRMKVNALCATGAL